MKTITQQSIDRENWQTLRGAFISFGGLNFTDCLGCGCGDTMEGNKQNNIADTDG